MVKSLLVVDDDPTSAAFSKKRSSAWASIPRPPARASKPCRSSKGPSAADIALVLLDLVMPGLDGMAVLDKLNAQARRSSHHRADGARLDRQPRSTPCAPAPSTSSSSRSSPERLEVSIKSALKIEALAGEISRIKKKVEGTLTFADLVVRGEGMERVVALGKRTAASNIPVLIEGESGVGKELIARAIQGESERAGKPFVAVNCGAIPENLVESILFGHEKGSFTGAVDKRIGKFQEADGGTLFLDEVGELPLEAQVKLLRALQEGEIDPVGAKQPVKVDFRLISATNRDMIQLVQARASSARISTTASTCFPIWVPPLRERLEDVPSWRSTSWRASPPRKASASAASATTRCACSRATPGPATCASSRTRCSAPSCWPTAPS